MYIVMHVVYVVVSREHSPAFYKVKAAQSRRLFTPPGYDAFILFKYTKGLNK